MLSYEEMLRAEQRYLTVELPEHIALKRQHLKASEVFKPHLF